MSQHSLHVVVDPLWCLGAGSRSILSATAAAAAAAVTTPTAVVTPGVPAADFATSVAASVGASVSTSVGASAGGMIVIVSKKRSMKLSVSCCQAEFCCCCFFVRLIAVRFILDLNRVTMVFNLDVNFVLVLPSLFCFCAFLLLYK